MSVTARIDGRLVHEDDLAAQLHETDTALVSDVLDYLELVARAPEAYGQTTAAACRGALNLIAIMAEQLGWVNFDELGVRCR